MKTYETWQVVKALTEHENWSAIAPYTSLWFECIPESKSGGNIRFSKYDASGELTENSDMPKRSDWRLFDTDGNEVTDYE